MDTTPHNKDIEEAVISRLLDQDQGPDAMLQLLEAGGNASWFFVHRALFKVVAHHHEKELPLDPIAFPQELETRGILEGIGGVPGFMRILVACPTHGYFAGHLKQLREMAVRRGALSVAADLEAAASVSVEKVLAVLNEPANNLIEASIGPSHLASGRDATGRWGGVWQQKLAGTLPDLLETGVPGLDDMRGGVEKASFLVIGAYPASGKTALGCQMACHALREGRRTLFFSLEMVERQLIDRMLIHLCGFPNSDPITSPTDDIPKKDLETLRDAVQCLSEAPLLIEDRAGLHIRDIVARAKLEHRKQPLDLIVVDFIQRVKGEGKVEERLTMISDALQNLMKDLDCQVVALSQLNKEGTAKYAASIEEAADLMLSIDRQPGDAEVRNVYCKKGRHRGFGGEALNITLDKNRQRFVSLMP
jgi:replicative DNA helicase